MNRNMGERTSGICLDRFLLSRREVDVVQPVGGEGAPEPGIFLLVASRFLAAILLPLDVRLGVEDALYCPAPSGGMDTRTAN